LWKPNNPEIQVLETRKRVLREEHPDTLLAMSNLAFTLKSQSRIQEAGPLLGRCCQIRKRISGPNHPDTESLLEILNEWQMEAVEIRDRGCFFCHGNTATPDIVMWSPEVGIGVGIEVVACSVRRSRAART
jgi:hypothetical protein